MASSASSGSDDNCNTTAINNTNDNNNNDNKDVVVEDVVPHTKANDILTGATLDDVHLDPAGTLHAFTPYNKRQYKNDSPGDKGSILIDTKGVKAKPLTIDQLVHFCRDNHMKEQKLNKQELINNVNLAAEAWKVARAFGMDPKKAVAATEIGDIQKKTVASSKKEPAVN
jgi:hypothetical protein